MTVIGMARQSAGLYCQNLHIEDKVTPGQRVREINNHFGI